MGSGESKKKNILKGTRLVCAAGELQKVGLKCWEKRQGQREHLAGTGHQSLQAMLHTLPCGTQGAIEHF